MSSRFGGVLASMLIPCRGWCERKKANSIISKAWLSAYAVAAASASTLLPARTLAGDPHPHSSALDHACSIQSFPDNSAVHLGLAKVYFAEYKRSISFVCRKGTAPSPVPGSAAAQPAVSAVARRSHPPTGPQGESCSPWHVGPLAAQPHVPQCRPELHGFLGRWRLQVSLDSS
jgi:hypothetical protein